MSHTAGQVVTFHDEFNLYIISMTYTLGYSCRSACSAKLLFPFLSGELRQCCIGIVNYRQLNKIKATFYGALVSPFRILLQIGRHATYCTVLYPGPKGGSISNEKIIVKNAPIKSYSKKICHGQSKIARSLKLTFLFEITLPRCIL
jgi:hypothetical protein